MTRDKIVAFRDPHGLRPLALGMIEDRYCVASESCALDIIGARFLREVEPGEVLTIDGAGSRRGWRSKAARRAFCVFEYIYFARPDSQDGRHRAAGRARADGRDPRARGAGRRRPRDRRARLRQPRRARLRACSGIPHDDGFVKNRYVARTFIQPGQELRKHGLRLKFNPMPEIVAGKRLVVVDDSIVRGNTTRQIVQMLRDAGAKEVHLRITAPPIRHPCHYGIDMSTREEMVAHGREVDEIAAELGADSLHYISLEGVYEAVGATRETHCDACFTGEYPLPDGPGGQDKHAFEQRFRSCVAPESPISSGVVLRHARTVQRHG